MKISSHILLLFVLGFFHVVTFIHADHERKPYIVYMGDLLGTTTTAVVDGHHSLLSTVLGNEDTAIKSRLHSYGKSFNGFVAMLLPDEAHKLSADESVVSVFPNKRYKLHTTRSWDFVGLPETSKKRNPMIESNLVVGLLDTGIWVDAPSFKDEGYGPIPPKWKGKCVKGANFTGCNKKVIGAKYYNLEEVEGDELTPVDRDGHGTHTASTAAGEVVKGASLYGIGKGTARGGVPAARIAMYKVCWSSGCSSMDLLAGFDDAIADGVDLISVSIGGPSNDYFDDPIAIGSFHAMKKGILTSCSAGNDGPYEGTVQNTAPWIMTVAATGIDREFRTAIRLGNGKKSYGIAINTFTPKKKIYPLTSGALASNATGGSYGNSSACDYGTLSQQKVKGKIVFCLGGNNQDYNIKELRGAGTIMALDEVTDTAFTTIMSATYVFPKESKKIDHYINTTKNAQAVIYKTSSVNISAPFVASFSSRGPQEISRNILKPDIAAPGLDILAGYSKLSSLTGDPTDKRYSAFNIISGTSMACPHAASAAAYVKSFHPDWSPAAIKSALMTTATPMKIEQKDSELGSGSGQINPTKAIHPGLIYDISMSSYIGFLCKEGYNSTMIGLLIGSKKKFDCANFQPSPGSDSLNYPSMHIQLNSTESKILAVFHRTVTHVGNGKSVYKATVRSPKGLSVKVVPRTLTFSKTHQKKVFKVVVKGGMLKGTQILSALFEWNDSGHSVKSPIVAYKSLY